MCNKILSLLANLYPFNSKINRPLFLKLNFFFTIILAVVLFNDSIDIKYKTLFIPIVLLFLSPIGIYQYLSDENPIQYGVISSLIICIGEFFLLVIVLFLLVKV